ncbi:LOW QUALITY PROTEIN: monosaccharide-transporting ATPase, partial [Brucella abortus bv. 9 str. C68]
AAEIGQHLAAPVEQAGTGRGVRSGSHHDLLCFNRQFGHVYRSRDHEFHGPGLAARYSCCRSGAVDDRRRVRSFHWVYGGLCRPDFCRSLVVWQVPLAVAIIVTLLFAALVGAVNAQIVIRTGLPSFIVTLAFLFILRGLSLVGLKWATGGSTQLRGVKEAVSGSYLAGLFSGDAFPGLFAWLAEKDLIAKFPNGEPAVKGVPVEVLWFVVIALVATYILVRTRFGNWIFAAGGDALAARNSGVPVRRVKTTLFMCTAMAAALVAILTVLDAGSTDARRGFQKEFEAIIAAVIGGCLLTGGYGSAIGAFFGAIIFGMVLIGLTYTQIDQDWYLVFLGGMLLIAVLFNNFIRKRATGER